MRLRRPAPSRAALAALLAGTLAAVPVGAVMDIGDRGPVLNAGNFAMRITNVGVIGNAFFDRGLSFDPSFEFPRGSGHEAMGHAELWVGAVNAAGQVRVSGGPMLEWRPTLEESDRVQVGWAGRRGSRRGVDDDGDGKADEEVFNGRDDDGDGEVDEDLGFPAQQVLAADYVDDRPEAVNYGYPNGEHHDPLGLSVHQEAYAWSAPGYDAIAGLSFTITNHGDQPLTQVWLGLYCDLDSRGRQQPGGYLDDLVTYRSFSRTIPEGTSAIHLGGGTTDPAQYLKQCFTTIAGTVPVVTDHAAGPGLPLAAVLPLSHTTDPLARITNFAFPGAQAAHDAARAPALDTTFRFSVFAQDLPPGQGGPPVLDEDRYAALTGRYRAATRLDVPHDYSVLVSCGPFTPLAPGQSVEFALALVVADTPDSLVARLENAATLYHGYRANLIADDAQGRRLDQWDRGVSGINGHEICLEPPPGIVFNYDPHCPDKFMTDPAYQPPPLQIPPLTATEVTYRAGQCIWTDLDCDACSGLDGAETAFRWLNPGLAPPAPAYRAARGDHEVTVAWDNMPEIVVDAGLVTAEGFHFSGYRVYRLSQWNRESILPPPDSWELIRAFGTDSLDLEAPLASVTDSTLDYDYVLYGRNHYPIGRYRLTDRKVLNGFDYLYVVTSVAKRIVQVGSATRIERLESPLVTSIDSVVVPHLAARKDAARVWVVPNPYRAHAPWDRPPVAGDPFGRHVDFFGLPRARSTIRIYTVAGDLVAQLDHDGRDGDGQASWNLISRNGQDVESGIYLFTVDSTLGHFTGRFVLIR